MPRDARFGVFEMGMNHAGELAALTRLVRPHVAIVTTIAPAHREFFASDEAIADAKGEIFQGLEPGGTAIIPYDSPHRDRLIAAARPMPAKIVTFGLGEGADVRADLCRCAGRDGGSLVTAQLPGRASSASRSRSRASIGWPTRWPCSPRSRRWAAISPPAGLALAELGGLKGRGERHRVAVEGGEALLIDESYNANPGLDGGDAAGARRGEGRRPAHRRARLDARARRRTATIFTPRSGRAAGGGRGRLCDPGRRGDGSARKSAWRRR